MKEVFAFGTWCFGQYEAGGDVSAEEEEKTSRCYTRWCEYMKKRGETVARDKNGQARTSKSSGDLTSVLGCDKTRFAEGCRIYERLGGIVGSAIVLSF